MNKAYKIVVFLFALLLLGSPAFANGKGDTRYDSNMNLPFNKKAGDVNPQTGNLKLTYTDVFLPGRAGFNFTFGRIWSLNQSNAFNMYFDGKNNRLNSNTVEKMNRLGVGWSTTMPYIMENSDTAYTSLNLFFGGNVYEIDQTGINGGDIPSRSNLLGYDLTDLRVFKDSSVIYGQFTELAAMKVKYSTLTDNAGDSNAYTLVTKSNEKFFFRADGRLMMKQDRSGLNRIWYFYKGSELTVVVDSIGREIRFTYTPEGNLQTINWDVTIGSKDSVTGVRSFINETRAIQYTYLDGEIGFSEVAALKGNVLDYRKPYLLSTMVNGMGHVTKFDYQPGKATFTYDSANAHSENLYLMLKDITYLYTPDGKYKNKRCFEYEVPGKGMYTKYFFNGMSEYYKISRQYQLNKNGRVMNSISYRYFEQGYNGNYHSYSSEITADRIKSIYKYTLSDSSSTNHVLDTLTMISDDESFIEYKDYIYAPDRTKIKEDTYRLGRLVYSENFQYDNRGNLKRHEDKVGLISVTTYDDKYSTPLNRTITVTVNGVKEDYRSENVINSLGQLTHQILHLKGENGVTKKVNALTIDYDQYGNRKSQTDAAGNTTHTVYDEVNHIFPVKIYQDVYITDWGVGTVHSEWTREAPVDPVTGLVKKKKVRVRSWKVFNSDGSVWIDIDNDGYAAEYYYNKNGQEIERVIPDTDDVTDFATPININEATGNPIELDFNDFTKSSRYTDFLTSRKNNPGKRTEIDFKNDLVKVHTDLDKEKGHVKIDGSEGDGLGNILRSFSYKGGVIHSENSMVYDDYGKMIILTDDDADLSTGTPITIDGQVYTRYDRSWVVKYDSLGRKVKVLYPVTRGRFDIKKISYDDISNKVTTTDPEGITIDEVYDWNGNLIKIVRYGKNGYTSADMIETYTFEYDELKRKVKFTDAMGLVTKYRYDERDLLIEQSYDNSGSDLMSYDDRGLLISKRDRKGNRIDFEYDGFTRNTEARHYIGGVHQYTTRLDYDNGGNPVRISNGKLIEHCTYNHANKIIKLERKLTDQDVFDKLKKTVWPQGNSSEIFTFEYRYNDAGLVTDMIYPDGSVHKYDYDGELSLLNKIHEASEQTTMDSQLLNPTYKSFIDSFTYSKGGAVTSMVNGNGTSQIWEYDSRKRISRTSISGSSRNIADLRFTLNGNGDIERINNHEYRYDGFNRVVYARTQTPNTKDFQQLVAKHFGTYLNGDVVNGEVYNIDADIHEDGRINGLDHILASFKTVEDVYDNEQFEYDKNGNRVKLIQNGNIYTYEYGARNRLEKVFVMAESSIVKTLFAEYQYDANGNTIRRTLHKAEGLEIIDFEYDTLNRVVKTTKNGSEITKYSYDNAGNRLTKETGNRLTLYLRHGQIAVAMDLEVNLDMTAVDAGRVNRYILFGELLAGRVTKEFARDTTTKVIGAPVVKKYWYHLDHLNSTKAVTKEDGTLVVYYEYRAFGEQLKKIDAAGNKTSDKAKYSYGGKELDEATNLYYFNARYYDATTGRFINVDPVQDGTNWYIYCNNNPLNRIDPTGLMGDLRGKSEHLKKIGHGKNKSSMTIAQCKELEQNVNSSYKGNRGQSIGSGAEHFMGIFKSAYAIKDSVSNFVDSLFRGDLFGMITAVFDFLCNIPTFLKQAAESMKGFNQSRMSYLKNEMKNGFEQTKTRMKKLGRTDEAINKRVAWKKKWAEKQIGKMTVTDEGEFEFSGGTLDKADENFGKFIGAMEKAEKVIGNVKEVGNAAKEGIKEAGWDNALNVAYTEGQKQWNEKHGK